MIHKKRAFLLIIFLIILSSVIISINASTVSALSFSRGTTITISWDPQSAYFDGENNYPLTDMIILIKFNGNLIYTSPQTPISQGSFSWTIPTNADLGAGYTIEAIGHIDPGTLVGSDAWISYNSQEYRAFDVTAQPSTYQQGDTVHLKWTLLALNSMHQLSNADINLWINNPSGNSVYTETHTNLATFVLGDSYYSIPLNAPLGIYTLLNTSSPNPNSYGSTSTSSFFDISSNLNLFNVIAITYPTCDYTYDNWGACINGQQSRVEHKTPPVCQGGTQQSTTQDCQSLWGGSCYDDGDCNSTIGLNCKNNVCAQLNLGSGEQCDAYRQCISSLNCVLGKCTAPTCTFTYSNWGACINGQQSRTYSSSPAVCQGGTLLPLTQSCEGDLNADCQGSSDWQCNSTLGLKCLNNKCNYPTCVYTYDPWIACSNGWQSRVEHKSPPVCQGGTQQSTNQQCEGDLNADCQSPADYQCNQAQYLKCKSNKCSHVYNKCTSYTCTETADLTSNPPADSCLLSGVNDCKSPIEGPCSSSPDCQAGLTCKNSQCVDEGNGYGETCYPIFKTCGDHLTCTNGICKDSDGVPCSDNTRCASPYCNDDGTSNKYCSSSPPTCTFIYDTNWGVCENGKQSGGYQTTPSNCQGGGTPTPLTQDCEAPLGGLCSDDGDCNQAQYLKCIYGICNHPACESFTYTIRGECDKGYQPVDEASRYLPLCSGSPQPKLQCYGVVGNNCDDGSTNQCASGLKCIGSKCSHAYNKCTGYTCTETADLTSNPPSDSCSLSNAYACKVPLGGTCGSNYDCEPLLTCQDTADGKKCVSEGNAYSDTCFPVVKPCDDYLTCVGYSLLPPAFGICKDSDGVPCSDNTRCASPYCNDDGTGNKYCRSSPPVCTFTYSLYAACHNGTQSRQILTKSPANCEGGTPDLTLPCLGVLGDVCNLSSQCADSLGCFYDRCVSFSAVEMAVWMNLINQNINNAEKGDTVRLRISGSNIEGKIINYTIYREVGGFFSSSFEPIYSVETTSQIIDYIFDSGGNYNFTAKVKSTGLYFTSDKLVVSDSPSDSPPVAGVESPLADGLYLVNTVISFNQSAYDEDSRIVSYEWDFGDGSPKDSNENTTHIYSTTGSKIAKLTVTDEQGASSTIQVFFTIFYSGKNIIIRMSTTPSGAGIVTDCSSPLTCLKVAYTGERSYVIDVDVSNDGSTINKITCLAGNCPLRTSTGFPIDHPSSVDYSEMFYNWTSSEEGIYPYSDYAAINGQVCYALPNQETLALTLNYSDKKEAVLKSFSVFSKRQCSADGKYWYNIDSNGNINSAKETMQTDSTVCNGTDKIPGTSDDCCPQGFACTDSGCVVDGDGARLCSDYATSDTCNADAAQRVKNEPLWYYEPECGKIVNGSSVLCACQWNNGCKLVKTLRNASSCGQVSSCVYSTEISTSCDSGWQVINIISAQGTEKWCTDAKDKKPSLVCGPPIIQMPFFTIVQAIIAIGIVFLLYFLLRNCKDKSKRHRHVFK
jgi:PKD repeat protein